MKLFSWNSHRPGKHIVVNRADTSDLCVECGLCCDGSLFADVELANQRESTLMESVGALVDEDEDSPLLIQPCLALQGKRCSIYHLRPKCCRTFECLLLKRVQRKEVPMSSARNQVRETLRLKAKIEAELRSLPADEPNLPLKERCQDAISTNSTPSKRAADLERMVSKFETTVSKVFLGSNISA